MTSYGQTDFAVPTTVFVMHSSELHLKMGSDNGGFLESATVSNPQKMTIVPDGQGYYYIKQEGKKRYLSKINSWNTSFVTDSTSDDARFTFEQAQGAYIRIRCKGNGQCLGTDSNDADAKVYSDKNGSDMKHFWCQRNVTYRYRFLCCVPFDCTSEVRWMGRFALLVGRSMR